MARNRYLDDEEEVVKLNAGLLKRLFRYMIPYKKLFFAGLFLLIINVLVTLIWPRMTQWIIDDVLSINGAYANSIKALLTVIGIVSFVLFVDVFLAAKRVILITKLGHNTIYDIRQEIFDHVQTLSFKYFDDRPAGKIMVRITNYVDSLSNLLSSQIIQLIVDVFTLLCILVILLSMNLRLTLLSFAVIIPLSLFIIFLRRIIAKWARRVRAKSSNRTAYIHENIMGTYVTQSFNREQYNHKEMIRLDDDVNYQFIRLHLSSATLGPAVDILSTIGTILVYFVAIQFIAGGEMTLGALTAFTTYMTRFWQPIASFTTIFNQFCEATSNIERIFETIDTEPEIEDRPDAYVLPDITGRVEYKNVDFSYDGKVNILENVSFTVEPGQMIAFVGPTGAGKTTVVNLLSRFYDVTGGSVEIDGHDVRNVTLQSLRTQVGVMMQDSFIFTGTIMDNIRYGRPKATDEECIAAARKVYASEFIERLPEGYNTKVQERGAGLSTGERQLLSFARAVLANPKILILDEATSSIDTRTELKVQAAFQNIMEGRTSFIVAHRLSTIQNATTILVMEQGKIIEQGNHQTLLSRNGFYAKLYHSQFANA